MVAHISQADAMHNVGSVFANISASSPGWMIHGIFRKLVDFITASKDYIALFEFCFCFHISKSRIGRGSHSRCLRRHHANVLRDYGEPRAFQQVHRCS